MIVVDHTVFEKYKKLYNQLNDDLVMQYLKIHYAQAWNAVCK